MAIGRLTEYAPDKAAYLRGTPRLGTSADEAIQLARAQERLREAIAAKVESKAPTCLCGLDFANPVSHWSDCERGIRLRIAAEIREDGRKG